jgi:hypothetical protein
LASLVRQPAKCYLLGASQRQLKYSWLSWLIGAPRLAHITKLNKFTNLYAYKLIEQ